MSDSPVILVIEDEPGDAQLIRWKLLEKQTDAFQVHLVASLNEAEHFSRTQRPDVILLDLNLPDSTGVNTVVQCKKRLPDCPLVVLTGLSDLDAVSPAIDAGAEDYLSKDAEGSELRKAIRYAILRHRRESEARLAASVFSHAREAIMITSPTGIILDVNSAFESITGYTRQQVLGRHPRLLNSQYQGQDFYREGWGSLLNQGAWEGEVWNIHASGREYPTNLTLSAVHSNIGEITHVVVLFMDISAQKAYQNQLQHMAHYDALTGLPNRTLLSERLTQGLADARGTQQGMAVIFVDLDGFKAINDTYGHDAGDFLLKTLAKRMQASLRDTDTLARIGGDEFVALVKGIKNEHQILPLVERLLAVSSTPVTFHTTPLHVSASCGITLLEDTGLATDTHHILRQADQAMYAAKQAGKNCYRFFSAA
ncbi:PAS domain S-box-containing protein/diguanylate cyclase (GGDEF) domain-containing protein [Allopseudospirillum japonicum]|uniref:PAS domain S-box-containing protein/diguanylate cyclase (GGDEF) domain-containing protein n=1 Tax=Allopseudospirillum japonicum TaxID=64971 RepID=A0A1H6SNC4_9GAMM|nr:diguanylate cyclase [Allopseudospirillum japonicum]SEI65082.1 PAS domain S-box-containing protein/diguanylate cyclase (GGDEF) domain-containing protein [Allopseudospirillum japonicum]